MASAASPCSFTKVKASSEGLSSRLHFNSFIPNGPRFMWSVTAVSLEYLPSDPLEERALPVLVLGPF